MYVTEYTVANIFLPYIKSSTIYTRNMHVQYTRDFTQAISSIAFSELIVCDMYLYSVKSH